MWKPGGVRGADSVGSSGRDEVSDRWGPRIQSLGLLQPMYLDRRHSRRHGGGTRESPELVEKCDFERWNDEAATTGIFAASDENAANTSQIPDYYGGGTGYLGTSR
ncbi:hypothetical protein HRR84_000214 [Exophiala dermatitidis]|nr:hypothetical protein HRR84_000214 [Exophiala dermatitidis]KAJ4687770.1 hypothetical protein HRR92_000214 [Exophiala dermatitidis]